MNLRARWLQWRLRRQARLMGRMMMIMNRVLLRAHWPKWKRDQFWHDFVYSEVTRLEAMRRLREIEVKEEKKK